MLCRKIPIEVRTILQHTHSGGVCINDTLMHVGADDAPFGGIGESGLGNYHGREGFDTFCHKRTVLKTPVWLPRVKLILRSKKLALTLLTKLFYSLNGYCKKTKVTRCSVGFVC